MLVTGLELIRVEPDGSRVLHADLSHISPLGWSDLTVDGRGNVYVNTINFDFAGGTQRAASRSRRRSKGAHHDRSRQPQHLPPRREQFSSSAHPTTPSETST
jgi:hypothetical protein